MHNFRRKYSKYKKNFKFISFSRKNWHWRNNIKIKLIYTKNNISNIDIVNTENNNKNNKTKNLEKTESLEEKLYKLFSVDATKQSPTRNSNLVNFLSKKLMNLLQLLTH